MTTSASVDPPLLPIGAGSDRAPEAPSQDGGVSGFSNHASCWDCLAGQPECLSEVLDHIQRLEESPELRSAATLRSLDRLRDQLERIPESASLNDPVVLRLGDVLVIARQMLSRLR